MSTTSLAATSSSASTLARTPTHDDVGGPVRPPSTTTVSDIWAAICERERRAVHFRATHRKSKSADVSSRTAVAPQRRDGVTAPMPTPTPLTMAFDREHSSASASSSTSSTPTLTTMSNSSSESLASISSHGTLADTDTDEVIHKLKMSSQSGEEILRWAHGVTIQ